MKKDNREYKLFTETRGYWAEFFFYTDDGVEPRIVSPTYKYDIEKFDARDAHAIGWDAFLTGVGIDGVNFKTGNPPYSADTVNEKIDYTHNKKSEELENLPKEFTFEIDGPRETKRRPRK